MKATFTSSLFSKFFFCAAITILAQFIILNSGNAQGRRSNIKVRLSELYIGGSFTNFNYLTHTLTSPKDQNNARAGLNLGLQAEIEFFGIDILTLAPEVYFIQNGNKEMYSNIPQIAGDLHIRKIKLNYAGVNVPLKLNLLNKDYFSGNRTGVILSASGYLDYGFKAEFYDISSAGDAAINPVIFGGITDRFDLGYSLGIALVKNDLTLKIGYVRGINNIDFQNDVQTENGFSDYLVNNKGITVSLGVLF